MNALISELVLLHLGSLHTYETVLLGVLAFGPFVVLAVVVYVIRRRDIAAEELEAAEGGTPERGDDSAGDRAGRRGTVG